MECSLPGSSAHGILQAKILEWVAVSSSGDLPDPGTDPAFLASAALADGFFTTSATWADLESSLHGDHPSRDYSRSHRALPWPVATEQGVVPAVAGE